MQRSPSSTTAHLPGLLEAVMISTVPPHLDFPRRFWLLEVWSRLGMRQTIDSKQPGDPDCSRPHFTPGTMLCASTERKGDEDNHNWLGPEIHQKLNHRKLSHLYHFPLDHGPALQTWTLRSRLLDAESPGWLWTALHQVTQMRFQPLKYVPLVPYLASFFV